ncbi:MAG: PhoH family protein [Candidatus Marinimicrobia bacterium]|nr:PhoH family protein [Candidatus Neomarinimicrobiota bacterium]
MKETKREIILKGIDPVSIFGINDENLEVIRTHFKATLIPRGNNLIITGEFSTVEQIHHLLNELIKLLPQKKNLTKHDVETLINIETSGDHPIYSEPKDDIILFTQKGIIKPRTKGQKKYYEISQKNDITFAVGPAGTGKTYQAVAVAVASLKNREVSKIILSRPAVEAGEQLGFLPGDMKDKIDPYLTPLYDALMEMITPTKLKTYLEKKIVEIVPLAFMRGRTLDSAYLILDEAQNTTKLQMKMFLTRIGVNSKAIITGDMTQIDIPKKTPSGLINAMKILKNIDNIGFCELTESDVVRHPLVKKIIRAYSEN